MAYAARLRARRVARRPFSEMYSSFLGKAHAVANSDTMKASLSHGVFVWGEESGGSAPPAALA